MKNIVLFILSVFMLLGISCKENVALEYENDPALYFTNDPYGQRDSIHHSFFTIDKNRDTVYVEIQAMGMTSNNIRPFVLEQTNEGAPNAAIAGVHYIAFDDPSVSKYYMISANNVKVNAPIILLRDESLNTGEVRLAFKISPNEYFRPGIAAWANFLIKTSSQASKPKIWDTYWKNRFGASWGPVKMKFIIDITGNKDWDTAPDDPALADYWSLKVKDAFWKYNEENPNYPLKEADDTLVSFTE